MEEESGHRRMQEQCGGSHGMKGALGVRKQARDIASGGWRGSSASSHRGAVLYEHGSQPQHVQGARVTYEQRPGSRGSGLQRPPQHSAVAYSSPRILGLDDEYDAGDGYQLPYRGSRSVSARPSSPDAFEAVGWSGRPSTPDGAALSPVPVPQHAAALRRPAAHMSFLRCGLVHLDLSGNRHDCGLQSHTSRVQRVSLTRACRLEAALPMAVAACQGLRLQVMCTAVISLMMAVDFGARAGPCFARESSAKADRYS